MRLSILLPVNLLLLLLVGGCTPKPSVDAIFSELKAGEARILIDIDGDAFYPDDSRFKGEVTISPNTINMNLFDQHESNVMLSLGDEALFAQKPVKRPIVVDKPSAGSVMIGRVRDAKLRTGDGFLMSEGDVTIVSLSAQKIVIQFTGMTGNFNTLRDPKTWKKLDGLLVYKRPTITMRGGATSALLY